MFDGIFSADEVFSDKVKPNDDVMLTFWVASPGSALKGKILSIEGDCIQVETNIGNLTFSRKDHNLFKPSVTITEYKGEENEAQGIGRYGDTRERVAGEIGA